MHYIVSASTLCILLLRELTRYPCFSEVCKDILARAGFEEVNAKTQNGGGTVLHIAAGKGQSDLCAAILARPDCDVNAKTKEGNTALPSPATHAIWIQLKAGDLTYRA